MKKLMKMRMRMMKIPGIMTQMKRRMSNIGQKRDIEKYSQPR
jgi:hypothetical protein